MGFFIFLPLYAVVSGTPDVSGMVSGIDTGRVRYQVLFCSSSAEFSVVWSFGLRYGSRLLRWTSTVP